VIHVAVAAIGVVVGFFAANVLGAAVGLALIASRRISRDHQIPYGVFLALGAAVAIYADPTVHLHLRGL